jgi:hypothetical protein
MKRYLAVLLLLALSICSTFAAEEEKPITKDIALKAIALFRANPGSEDGRGAAAIIFRFAEASPDVTITLSKDLLPWVGTNPGSKYESLLLAAYIAGSTQAQLLNAKSGDDKLAGTLLLNEIYLKLQQDEPNLHIDTIEKSIELQKQGKLKEYLESK